VGRGFENENFLARDDYDLAEEARPLHIGDGARRRE